jgi:AcrR family transcriptional regulator
MSARTATPKAGVGGGTRERIVDTALRLYSERGTARVSMRELAEAAGVTVPGLYYHFASKADLIRAVYQARGFGAEPADFEPPLATQVEARIVERAGAEFARLVADEEFLRLMQREAVLGDEDALEAGGALAKAWRERWQLVLAPADDLRPDADLDAAADAIATFLWGLFVDYLNHRDPRVEGRIASFARLISPALTRVAP